MAEVVSMLRARIDFDAFADSRSRSEPLLVVRYRRNDLDVTRFGISTSRRLGSAVVRNRVRRRLRSILRDLLTRLEPGWDVLLVVRPPAAIASQADLDGAVRRLFGRAGLLYAERLNR
jgi:ribonuclease P protein component